MRATRANWDHGALEEASDTFDYVAVSHRDAHNWIPRPERGAARNVPSPSRIPISQKKS